MKAELKIRCDPELYENLKQAAAIKKTSLNTEAVFRLQSFVPNAQLARMEYRLNNIYHKLFPGKV